MVVIITIARSPVEHYKCSLYSKQFEYPQLQTLNSELFVGQTPNPKHSSNKALGPKAPPPKTQNPHQSRHRGRLSLPQWPPSQSRLVPEFSVEGSLTWVLILHRV